MEAESDKELGGVKKKTRYEGECVCGRRIKFTELERYKNGKRCTHDWVEKASGWSICQKCGRAKK